MRKIKDITIISYEKEIERVSKSIQEPNFKSIEYDSKIPFRRMHQKEVQEKQKTLKDHNSFFVSQKEFVDSNKSNKASAPNLHHNIESSRYPLKSINNIEVNEIIKKVVPAHTSTSNHQYIKYKSLQTNAPNIKKFHIENENNPNNINETRELTESKNTTKRGRNSSKESTNRGNIKHGVNIKRKNMFKSNNGEFFTKRKSNSKHKRKHRHLKNISSQKLFVANNASLKVMKQSSSQSEYDIQKSFTKKTRNLGKSKLRPNSECGEYTDSKFNAFSSRNNNADSKKNLSLATEDLLTSEYVPY